MRKFSTETTATGVGGGIVQTTITDLHGRTVSETAPGPMGTAETTRYAYSADGLVTTQTNPDGGKVVTTSHLDGQTKSITGPVPGEMTGSATIERHYLYGTHTENGGGEVTTVITANGTGGSTTTYSDLAGRTFKTERAAPHNQTAVTTTIYNALGQVETVISSGQTAKMSTAKMSVPNCKNVCPYMQKPLVIFRPPAKIIP